MVLPPVHQAWLARALPVLQAEPRLLAVGAAGSWLRGEVDAWSDLDLVLLVDPAHYDAVLGERVAMAERCGPLVAHFTAEHVGAPEMLIVLYGPPLLHVDLKFTTADRLAAKRVEDPAIVWERDGALTAALARGAPHWPAPDPQWLEDRFWTWIHYSACKLRRGELFETVSALDFLRGQVLAPLLCRRTGAHPQGQRRLEQRAGDDAPALRRTVAGCDPVALHTALHAVIDQYRTLRDAVAPPDLRRHAAAEAAVLTFLDAGEPL